MGLLDLNSMLCDREMPPPELIAAAFEIGRWFEERNIKDWALGPCASRAQLEELQFILDDLTT